MILDNHDNKPQNIIWHERPIEHWDVSQVNSMYAMFYFETDDPEMKACNPDISKWEVGSVTSFVRIIIVKGMVCIASIL